MIVAEQKPLEDLKRMMKGKKKVLAVGCGTCVAVCFSGGKKETSALASALETAAASSAVDVPAMGALMMGCSIPSRSQIRVHNM